MSYFIGKYYLVDTGYPNTVGYFAPVSDQGVRCHVSEYKHVPPNGMFEHYNYRHSSLRMSVEMSFGHLKKRWKVLYNMPQMSKKYQMAIIVSTFTLHNFIKMHTLGIPIVQHEMVQGEVDFGMLDDDRKNEMLLVRDEIVRQLWEDNQPVNEIEDEVEFEDPVGDNAEFVHQMEEDDQWIDEMLQDY